MKGMIPLAAADVADLADSSIDPTHLVGALVVLLLAWLASRLVRRAAARVLDRVDGVTPEVKIVAARICGYVVLFIGFGIALSFLGAEIQPVLAVAIVVGVVLVLALRGIADNFAAGILIQTRRPLRLGDQIESEGFVGMVKEINSRAVVIETSDGRQVHLPNAEVLANPMVNYTTGGAKRSALQVRLKTSDIEEARQRTLAAVASVPDVIADPAAQVNVTGTEPDTVVFTVWFWHAPPAAAAVTSEVITAIDAANRQHGTRTDISTVDPGP